MEDDKSGNISEQDQAWFDAMNAELDRKAEQADVEFEKVRRDTLTRIFGDKMKGNRPL